MERRRFLQAGLAILSASALPLRGLTDENPAEGFCLFMGDHWSYIGIGWQMGIESSALSVLDAMEISDRKPYAKTCINLDASAYEQLALHYPLLTDRLKKYLAADKVELIGGTYSQSMGTLFSGESDIRQIVTGRDLIYKTLGYRMETFLEEEEFSFPQLPQILVGAGYKYTSLSQLDTWAYAGCPLLPLNVFHWKAMDGTPILCAAKNGLFLGDTEPHDLSYLSTPEGKAEIARLQKLGKPLVQTWQEFGWEDPEKPDYLRIPEMFAALSAQANVEYVTLREYLGKYGNQARETIYLNMDAWKKLLPWGIGGDQIRVTERRAESLLLAAERLDALGSVLGSASRATLLAGAWRNLLTVQSHDVNLCEYARFQGGQMPPFEPIKDHHDQTWGSIGYHHLDRAVNKGQSVLDASLSAIANRIQAPHAEASTNVMVFNPSSWNRTSLTRTGKFYPKDRTGKNVSMTNGSGSSVPFQMERAERDSLGNLNMVDLTFLAEDVPAVGHDTYRLAFTEQPASFPATSLAVDEANSTMENAFVRIGISPKQGALLSIIDKKSGREFLDPENCPTPTFYGRPNLKYPFLARDPDTLYDSSHSTASVLWLEKGPLRATVKATHRWKQLTFESRISLTAHSPNVEVISRVLTSVPPATDPRTAASPGAIPRAERDIQQGYWLKFAPNFATGSVYRDFPFGIEETAHERLHGLTFADLQGSNQGLLIVHSGTQYFKQEAHGVWSNLVMREWESEFSPYEYGFTNYAEYKHILLAHGPEMNNEQRMKSSAEFDNAFRTLTGPSGSGELPRRKSFLRILPDHVLLSAFRKKEGPGSGYELRLVETAGKPATCKIELGFAASHAIETDLLGEPIGKPLSTRSLTLEIKPWQFRTLQIV